MTETPVDAAVAIARVEAESDAHDDDLEAFDRMVAYVRGLIEKNGGHVSVSYHRAPWSEFDGNCELGRAIEPTLYLVKTVKFGENDVTLFSPHFETGEAS